MQQAELVWMLLTSEGVCANFVIHLKMSLLNLTLCFHIAGYSEGEDSWELGEVCSERCKYLVFFKEVTSVLC